MLLKSFWVGLRKKEHRRRLLGSGWGDFNFFRLDDGILLKGFIGTYVCRHSCI